MQKPPEQHRPPDRAPERPETPSERYERVDREVGERMMEQALELIGRVSRDAQPQAWIPVVSGTVRGGGDPTHLVEDALRCIDGVSEEQAHDQLILHLLSALGRGTPAALLEDVQAHARIAGYRSMEFRSELLSEEHYDDLRSIEAELYSFEAHLHIALLWSDDAAPEETVDPGALRRSDDEAELEAMHDDDCPYCDAPELTEAEVEQRLVAHGLSQQEFGRVREAHAHWLELEQRDVGTQLERVESVLLQGHDPRPAIGAALHAWAAGERNPRQLEELVRTYIAAGLDPEPLLALADRSCTQIDVGLRSTITALRARLKSQGASRQDITTPYQVDPLRAQSVRNVALEALAGALATCAASLRNVPAPLQFHPPDAGGAARTYGSYADGLLPRALDRALQMGSISTSTLLDTPDCAVGQPSATRQYAALEAAASLTSNLRTELLACFAPEERAALSTLLDDLRLRIDRALFRILVPEAQRCRTEAGGYAEVYQLMREAFASLDAPLLPDRPLREQFFSWRDTVRNAVLAYRSYVYSLPKEKLSGFPVHQCDALLAGLLHAYRREIARLRSAHQLLDAYPPRVVRLAMTEAEYRALRDPAQVHGHAQVVRAVQLVHEVVCAESDAAAVEVRRTSTSARNARGTPDAPRLTPACRGAIRFNADDRTRLRSEALVPISAQDPVAIAAGDAPHAPPDLSVRTYDAVFLDVDGTYIDSYADDASPLAAHLEALCAAGVPVALSSGAELEKLKPMFETDAGNPGEGRRPSRFPGLRLYGRGGAEWVEVGADGGWGETQRVPEAVALEDPHLRGAFCLLHAKLLDLHDAAAGIPLFQPPIIERIKPATRAGAAASTTCTISVNTALRTLSSRGDASPRSVLALATALLSEIDVAKMQHYFDVRTGSDGLQIVPRALGKSTCLRHFRSGLRSRPRVLRIGDAGTKATLFVPLERGAGALRYPVHAFGSDAEVLDDPDGFCVSPATYFGEQLPSRGWRTPLHGTAGTRQVLESVLFRALPRAGA